MRGAFGWLLSVVSVLIDGNEFILVFTSDDAVTWTGFNITFTVLEGTHNAR